MGCLLVKSNDNIYILLGAGNFEKILNILGMSVSAPDYVLLEDDYMGEYNLQFNITKCKNKDQEYFGFSLDQDSLYLDRIGVIHHNSGKTVVALHIAALMGQKTIVICPRERIMQQWKERAIEHLGIKEDDIGWVQSSKCDFDKPLVIASLHSIAMSEYPPELFKSFGLVVYDELHTAGSTELSKALGVFDAKYQID